MTYFGAKVLHFPAVLPAIAEKVPLVIRNSFNPKEKGTVISLDGNLRHRLRPLLRRQPRRRL